MYEQNFSGPTPRDFIVRCTDVCNHVSTVNLPAEWTQSVMKYHTVCDSLCKMSKTDKSMKTEKITGNLVLGMGGNRSG